MSGERSALTQTLSGLKGKCDSCPAISRLAIIVDNTRDDVRALQETTYDTAMSLAEMKGTVESIPKLIEALEKSVNHQIKTTLQVAVMSRSKADPDKTPSGWLSFKAAGVAWKGPTVLALFVVCIAAGAYVAGEWGPPGKTASVPAKTP